MVVALVVHVAQGIKLLVVLKEESLRVNAPMLHDIESACMVPVKVSQVICQLDGVF
jgi:hypothetical protein